MAQCWQRFFKGNVLAKWFAESGNLSNEDWTILKPHIAIWRDRLCHVSWFMQVLTGFLAREVNAEEICMGRLPMREQLLKNLNLYSGSYYAEPVGSFHTFFKLQRVKSQGIP